MKSTRPLFLTLFLVSFFFLPSACPIYYVTLNGYVQFSSENVTKKELYELNFNDIKDTSDQAMADKQISRIAVFIKRVTDEKSTYIRTGYRNEETSLEELYKSTMDTVLPKLNLQDSVFITYYLTSTEKTFVVDGGEQEFYVRLFDRFKMTQTFVISTQAVVDLKRNVDGNAVIAYPSPAEGYVSVKFNIKEPVPGKLQLVNSLGQEIASVNHSNLMEPYTFNIQSEPAGTYFVRAEMDGESFLVKFIKE